MATSPVFKMSQAAEGRSIGACKCQAGTSKHKMKRLRSRKERSQTRGSKDTCKVKARRCHPQGGLDVGHLHGLCRHGRKKGNASPPPSLCDALAPTQEASVITEARLIGHRGLFNREVKSIDIERLLLGKKEAKVKEANVKATFPHDASGPDEEAQATEAREGRETKSQTSDVTASASSADTPVAKSRIAGPRQGPPSSAERMTPRKNPPDPQRPVAVETAPSEGVARESVVAVARRLGKALRFPLMRRRDLLAESRDVLLRALREAHGRRLQQNLLHMHSGTGLHPHPRREVHSPEATQKERQRRTTPAPFQVHSADSFSFGKEEVPVFENTRKGKKRVSWVLSGPPQQLFSSQTGAWPTSRMGTSASFLEDVFRPGFSPTFNMDLGSSSAAVPGLFAPSPSWRAQPPVHGFGKTAVTLDPFQECFAERRSIQSQASYTQVDPRQPLTGRYSQENFPPERDPLFESQQFSFAPTFSPHPLTYLHGQHYQPSFSLESPPSSFTSLSSPKHWSFQPTKLY